MVTFNLTDKIKVGDFVEFFHPEADLAGMGEVVLIMGDEYQVQELSGRSVVLNKGYLTKVTL